MENYIPKVGDKVRITRGHHNWCDSMDQYINQEHEIKKVGTQRCLRVEFKDNSLGINLFGWFYSQGHFEPIKTEVTTFKFC